jgi:hypothetical protein
MDSGPVFGDLVKESIAGPPKRHPGVRPFHGEATLPAQGWAAFSQPFGETVFSIHAFGLDQAIATCSRKDIGKMQDPLEVGALAFQVAALKVGIGFDAGYPETRQE